MAQNSGVFLAFGVSRRFCRFFVVFFCGFFVVFFVVFSSLFVVFFVTLLLIFLVFRGFRSPFVVCCRFFVVFL